MSHDNHALAGSNIPSDRPPDRVEWAHREQELAYLYWNNWRQWRREYVKKYGWKKQPATQGRDAWRLLTEMVRAIETKSVDEMLANSRDYYHIKELEPPPEGRISMRYNIDIRLVFRLILLPHNDPDGDLVAEIIHFGFHYEGLR